MKLNSGTGGKAIFGGGSGIPLASYCSLISGLLGGAGAAATAGAALGGGGGHFGACN